MTQSVDPASEQEQSTVSGFHSYDAVKYHGFTSKNMSDLERIIATFTHLPKTQAVLAFYDQIRDHLGEKDGHHLDISQLSDELVRQLFYTYRQMGYTGSREDMIHAMVKTIEVGSVDDVLAGMSTKKAVNVPGWLAKFKEHSTDPEAHASFFDSLLPNDALNVDPDFYISYFFGEQNFLLEEEGYTITDWNKKHGTLYMALAYNFTDVTSVVEQTFLTLKFLNRTIDFVVSYEPSIHKANVFLYETNKITKKILGAITLPFEDKGYDRLVLIHEQDKCFLRSMLVTTPTFDNPFGNDTPIALELAAPIQLNANAKDKITIREVAHYPIAASISEQLFFLN